MKTLQKKNTGDGKVAILFLLPWLLGFVFIMGGPSIATFFLGFSRYDVMRPPKFVGMKNYFELFTYDELFGKSMLNTLYYVVLNVPLSVFGSLFLAMLLNNTLRGMNTYKTILYIPSIASGIAMAMLWIWFFEPNSGLVNTVLRNAGVSSPPLWFDDPKLVKLTLVLIKVVEIGGSRMIIFLAGLQNIPKSLYEVAYIDGANRRTMFAHITIPMLSPILLLNFISAIIDSFKVFIYAYSITEGGPLNESMFLVLYIYKKAFTDIRMGYASAIATVFLVIVFVLVVIQLSASRKWVYYEG
jgi:multiple sugar transport system permease protein